jgi:hypothetical protein
LHLTGRVAVLFRLWRGKGTSSQVELAAQMLRMLVTAFGDRVVHGVGDAAFHGESLAVEGSTWTTRLPANAVIATVGALWHGSFKAAPGRVVLARTPGSGKPYDLGLSLSMSPRPRQRS